MRGEHVSVIDLSRGEVPWDCIAALMPIRAPEETLRSGFSYSDRAGLAALRLRFVERFASVATDAEDTLVVGGALGGLDLALRALRRGGHRIRMLVQQPTYREALAIGRAHGARLTELDGRWENLSLGPRDVVYVVPSLNNPDGQSLDRAALAQIADAVVAGGAAVIEDAAYDLLQPTAARPTLTAHVVARDPHAWALRLYSFSKIVMPGARVCVVEGGKRALSDLRQCKVDFGTSPLACAWVSRIIAEPDFATHYVRAIADRLDRGRRAASEALDAWRDPPKYSAGGYFIWLDTGGIASPTMVARAGELGVGIADGTPFFVSGRRTHVRISVAWEPGNRIAEGCRRLEMARAGGES